MPGERIKEIRTPETDRLRDLADDFEIFRDFFRTGKIRISAEPEYHGEDEVPSVESKTRTKISHIHRILNAWKLEGAALDQLL